MKRPWNCRNSVKKAERQVAKQQVEAGLNDHTDDVAQARLDKFFADGWLPNDDFELEILPASLDSAIYAGIVEDESDDCDWGAPTLRIFASEDEQLPVAEAACAD